MFRFKESDLKHCVIHMKLFLKFIFPVIVFSLSLSCQTRGQKTQENDTFYENHIKLEGQENMRDLGGYTGAGGETIKYGKLFRSGELAYLTDDDLEIITNLGIEQIIDLRLQNERLAEPDKVPPGITQYHFPLVDDLSGGFSSSLELTSKILAREVRSEDYILTLYIPIDTLKINTWTKLFDLLEENKPTLWHCTSGKDRTGMTTALVLYSLGVDRGTIIQDFMKSNDYMSEHIEENVSAVNAALGENIGELFRPMYGVTEEYILTFLDEIETQYGSVDAFLKVLDVDIEKMQKNYLE